VSHVSSAQRPLHSCKAPSKNRQRASPCVMLRFSKQKLGRPARPRTVLIGEGAACSREGSKGVPTVGDKGALQQRAAACRSRRSTSRRAPSMTSAHRKCSCRPCRSAYRSHRPVRNASQKKRGEASETHAQAQHTGTDSTHAGSDGGGGAGGAAPQFTPPHLNHELGDHAVEGAALHASQW
jgi:hypothetical protein